MEITANNYDVAVIGAGPAGCEAALASARAGARTLCLTINLDMVGFPPASPVMVEDAEDRRREMLAELASLGGQLPELLSGSSVAGTDNTEGRVLVDRRRLGLTWKELLENEDRLFLRQALVTALEPCPDGWKLTTRLDENFTASAVVVAAGTFLNGRVIDAEKTGPGGRWAEIPSNSLPKYLQMLGLDLVQVTARTSPRVSARGLDSRTLEGGALRRDGGGLDEFLAYGLETGASRAGQLEALRRNDGLENAWITRASYAVLHDALAAGQVGEDLEVPGHPGLFFAGRAAGCCNYSEAAVLGFIAGHNAAGRCGMADAFDLTKNYKLVTRLLERIAHKKTRPVTVRVDGETGC